MVQSRMSSMMSALCGLVVGIITASIMRYSSHDTSLAIALTLEAGAGGAVLGHVIIAILRRRRLSRDDIARVGVVLFIVLIMAIQLGWI